MKHHVNSDKSGRMTLTGSDRSNFNEIKWNYSEKYFRQNSFGDMPDGKKTTGICCESL